MTKSLASLGLVAASAALISCSGGGGSSPAPIVAVATPTPSPTAKPTIAPSASPGPSPAPTASPTASPTQVPAALHVVGALASVFTAQGLVRRSAQDLRRIQSTNLGNGQIPTVIGATSPYYGTILTEVYAWAATPQNTPVPEVSLNAVPANAVSGPVSVVSVGQDNGNLFAQTYFDWVVQLGINKVGSGNIVATFKDGTTGSIPVYVYDEWYLTCPNAGGVTMPSWWAYKNGVPTGIANPPDMTVDCTGFNVTFPNGAIQQAAPAPDAWGNVASAFTTIASGTTNTAALTVSVASLKLGTIYIAKLSDGGYAKIMPLVSDGAANSPNISGISLHDVPSGSGQFPF
jgi:hypothetical protein